MENNKAIGIFDSGIGGLTVLNEVRALLPNEDIIYLGDTARVPYGTKSRETVLKYSIQNILFLLERGVKAVVIACNTASAHGLESVRGNFSVPVLGVIGPGALGAVQRTKTKWVGVIGTEGTIRSQSYDKAILELDNEVKTLGRACPLLVALAEEGWSYGQVVNLVLENYLRPFAEEKMVDTLILGCTHYPLFKQAIHNVLGRGIELVDSGVETARYLQKMLVERKMEREKEHKGETVFYSTDMPERMQRVGRLFLREEIEKVTKAEVTKY